jgi:regulator of sigma E protease
MELITTSLHYFLSFTLILSFIVFVHEFGHYIVAKWCGVKIVTFSIGFGREIYGFNDRSGTRWKFSVLPLGGYVKMLGDEGAASTPDTEALNEMTEEEKKVSFY